MLRGLAEVFLWIVGVGVAIAVIWAVAAGLMFLAGRLEKWFKFPKELFWGGLGVIYVGWIIVALFMGWAKSSNSDYDDDPDDYDRWTAERGR